MFGKELYMGKPEGTIIGYNDTNRWQLIQNKIKFFLSTNSNFYNLLAIAKGGGSSLQSDSQCKSTASDVIKDNSEKAFEVYSKTLNEASNYTTSNGAKFYHFFQPTLFSRSNAFSEYEMSLIRQRPSDMVPCNAYNDAFQNGYSIFKKKYASPKQFIGVDLTNILNPTVDKKEYFIDWIHVSSAANEKIAAAIYHSTFGE